jgi:hypothetical protein
MVTTWVNVGDRMHHDPPKSLSVHLSGMANKGTLLLPVDVASIHQGVPQPAPPCRQKGGQMVSQSAPSELQIRNPFIHGRSEAVIGLSELGGRGRGAQSCRVKVLSQGRLHRKRAEPS